ncbi:MULTISPECIES: putative beta-lysine N-acetyltransferase [Priestia]|uniref:putative beta-lysine N-acetyltransferase n=1 Tax=Priestia TaxID=2800373 RepID=UPI001C8E662B|nr:MULTISPECIES: putative beta-lysine N-acetyltransferase [Priestia]MBX9984472.1 putative beta-lysine N-acetyltransferase [Priestia aryabhattai]UYV51920.1 putative beta-lysine N-acetyltransferase [Priestia megaterium]
MAKQEKICQPTFAMTLFLDECNKRLRIDDYRGNVNDIYSYIYKEIDKATYEKWIIKARAERLLDWMSLGFSLEATVPYYFNGSDAYLLCCYTSQSRRDSGETLKETELLQDVLKLPTSDYSPLSNQLIMRRAISSDAKQLSQLYRQIFTVYPTPLYEEEYLSSLLQEDSLFYIIVDKNDIVSAASAEIDYVYHNAELTDCATLPAYRKYGFMKHLLSALEEELKQRHIFCAYTIARALSFGMNAAFHQLGYIYTGRLTNNCYIYKSLEDMNVWVKDLSKSKG